MFKNKKKQNLEEEKDEIVVDDKISIYVMPKSSGKMVVARKTEKTSKKNNKIGLVIFIIGGLILIALFVFLYFYLIGGDSKAKVAKNKPAEATEVKKPVSEKKPSTEEEKKELAETGDKDVPEKKAIVSKIVKPKQATDADGDGLTNLEEKILKIDDNLKDTDGDGFNDRSEVLNRYNPAGDGKISANPGLREYVNEKYKYSMVIPKSWELTEVDGKKSIIIKAPEGQMFQVGVSLNLNKESIEDWYRSQFDVRMIQQKNKLSISGVDAIKKDDGMFVYMTFAGNIYNVSYLLGEDSIGYFMNIFDLLLGSFRFTTID